MSLVFQVVPALKERQTVHSYHERKRLCDQAEIRQPLLLQGVDSRWVITRVVAINSEVR